MTHPESREPTRRQVIGAMVRDGWDHARSEAAILAIEAQAAAAARAEVARQVRTLYPWVETGGHYRHCNAVVFPGSNGPDPEPPDPCSCGGPELRALVEQDAAPREPEPQEKK